MSLFLERDFQRSKPLEPLLVDAWGSFLSQFPWTWFYTLTLKPFYKHTEVEVFHPAEIDFQGQLWPASTGVKDLRPPELCPVGTKRARTGHKIFVKRVRQLLDYPRWLEYFSVFQRQPHTRSIHAHGLAFGCALENVNRKQLEDWCFKHIGKAQIRLYNPMLGARFYTVQHLFHQDANAFQIAFSGLHVFEEGSLQPVLVRAAQVDVGQRLYQDLTHLSAPH